MIEGIGWFTWHDIEVLRDKLKQRRVTVLATRPLSDVIGLMALEETLTEMIEERDGALALLLHEFVCGPEGYAGSCALEDCQRSPDDWRHQHKSKKRTK